MLIDLGVDVNAQADTGRTALHGAAHKGATEVVRCSSTPGPSSTSATSATPTTAAASSPSHTWQPVDYADGLVRVGVQSAIPHPETGKLLRELMRQAGTDGAAEGPHARIDLHHRGVRYGPMTFVGATHASPYREACPALRDLE